MSEWTAETAEWYAARYGEYATNRLAADATEVARDAVVVDVGCGTGSALRRIAPRVPEGRLIGLEPTPRMLEIARKRASEDPNGLRIDFREARAEQLPLDDASADVVFAFDSIDHWQDKVAGLREIRRVLKPEGRLVVVKDGGLPGGAKANREFLEVLNQSNLKVMLEKDLAEGNVVCTMWVCGVA
jgi:ubiquinone/menaquinone biosynthesis C-methylase UbiE